MKKTIELNSFFNIKTTPLLFAFSLVFMVKIDVLAHKSEWILNNNATHLSLLFSADCDNVTDGGQIIGDEVGCNDPIFDPSTITNVILPSGGTGELEYIWVSTTDDPNAPFVVWNPIPGSTSAEYDPEPITQTTYFMRCARRSDCVDYIGESNIVVKEISCCDNIVDGGLILENQEGCEPSYDPVILTNFATPSGGSGAIEYLWFKSTIGPPFVPNSPDWEEIPEATGLEYDPLPISETTYFIRCSRREDCTTYKGESNIVVIALHPSPSIQIDAMTSPRCQGENDGSISTQVSGGTPPYNYTWSNNVSNLASISGLMAGSYTVTVIDDNGCTAVDNVNLSEPSDLTVEVTTTHADCTSNATGSATVTPSGGAAPYTYLWNDDNAQTTATASNLTAANYSVLITDANDCTKIIDVIIENENNLSLAITSTDVVCADDDNGSAMITPSGGTAPYSYLWSNGQTVANIANLTVGTYTVTLTDANNCSIVESLSIDETSQLSVATQAENASCSTIADGTVHTTVSGGTPPFSYQWNDPTGQISATAINLAIGNYNVVVTDADGCVAEAMVTIESPEAIIIMATTTTASCGISDGTASVIPLGGMPPYNYTWSDANSQITATAMALAAGTYEVTVTDANGCFETAEVSIVNESGMVLDIQSLNALCGDSSNGGALVNIMGGTAPFSYQWSDSANQTSSQASNLSAGTYSVTVTDANDCIATGMATINAPDALSVTTSQTDVDCPMGILGSATVVVSGGTPPYFYTWNDANNQTTATATNLEVGTYEVSITDDNDCTTTTGLTIQSINSLELEIATRNLSCPDANDGSIVVSVTDSMMPYTYLWSNSETTSSIDNLEAGTYAVTVTDANGCSHIESATITAPDDLRIEISTIEVDCVAGVMGTASTTISGGTAPYSYLWSDSNNQTGPNASNLTAGTYAVTVTDANGCSETASAEVSVDAGFTLAIQTTDLLCMNSSNGSASVNVTGGNAPFSYQWDDLANQTTSQAAGLSLGTYTVTVIDANNCTSTATATINAPDSLNVTIDQTDVDCSTGAIGSATAIVNGGTPPYFYIWNDTNNQTTETATHLEVGIYEVSIADSNNCTATASINIEQINGLEFNLSSTDVSCNGENDGTIAVDVTEGLAPYTYSWSNGASTSSIDNLTAGTYAVTVTDANGCSHIESATITAPDDLRIEISTIEVDCMAGIMGTASTTISGGTAPYNYSWNDTNNQTGPNATNLMAGTYVVTVTDANGCSQTANAEVSVDTGFTLAIQTTDLLCMNNSTGSASVNITGGTAPFSYQWNDSANQTTPQAAGLSAGTYTVSVIDANACMSTAMATIDAPDSLSLSITKTDLSCGGENNGAASVNVIGGTAPYTYSWSNGASTPSISNLNVGTYAVTVTDANACSTDGSIVLTPPMPIELSLTKTDVNCSGEAGTATVTANGGSGIYTYLWNDANAQTTATATALMSGNYTVVVTDENGCTASENVTIDAIGNIDVAIASQSTDICAGGSIFLSATPSGSEYTYDWTATAGFLSNPTSGSTSYTMMMTGTYTITVVVTNEMGCQNEASIDVIVHPEPDIEITANSTNVCIGSSITFSLSPTLSGFSYDWTASGGTFDNPNSASPVYNMMMLGSYDISVTATSTLGCSTTATTTATISDPPLCSVNMLSSISHWNGSDGSLAINTLNGTSPFSYQWSNGATTQTINGLSAGTYTVSITDAAGCTCEASANLSNPSKLGNFVWEDVNQDGIQDANEPGIENVNVILSGTDNNSNPITASTSTDANGMYMFDGLNPGTYKVSFEVPEGFVTTTANMGNDEALDSDVDAITNMTHTINLDAGEYYQDLDAGYIENVINIGNYVWNDRNRDGIQGGNEFGVRNVLVVLVDLGFDQTYGTADDQIIRSTTTDLIGYYLFTNVPSGKYVIEFKSESIPSGFVFTSAYQGGNDEMDSDADPITGASAMFMVLEGQEDDLSYDAGVYQKCNNVINGGEIQGDEVLCGSGSDPALITNIESPSGGVGVMEYLWMKSNIGGTPTGPDDPNWEVIPGATEAEYDPPIIFYHYLLCSLRATGML